VICMPYHSVCKPRRKVNQIAVSLFQVILVDLRFGCFLLMKNGMLLLQCGVTLLVETAFSLCIILLSECKLHGKPGIAWIH